MWCAGEVDKMSKKMAEAQECEVPVVDEAFLEDAGKGAALLKIVPHKISSWGAPRHSLPSLAEEDMTDSAHVFESTGNILYTNRPHVIVL